MPTHFPQFRSWITLASTYLRAAKTTTDKLGSGVTLIKAEKGRTVFLVSESTGIDTGNANAGVLAATGIDTGNPDASNFASSSAATTDTDARHARTLGRISLGNAQLTPSGDGAPQPLASISISVEIVGHPGLAISTNTNHVQRHSPASVPDAAE